VRFQVVRSWSTWSNDQGRDGDIPDLPRAQADVAQGFEGCLEQAVAAVVLVFR
jgi:hypothetical protein